MSVKEEIGVAVAAGWPANSRRPGCREGVWRCSVDFEPSSNLVLQTTEIAELFRRGKSERRGFPIMGKWAAEIAPRSRSREILRDFESRSLSPNYLGKTRRSVAVLTV